MGGQNENRAELRNSNEYRDEWLEWFMNEYGERLTKLAYGYVKDWGIAQDVVQDVFVICYRQYNQAINVEFLKAWVYRITINRCKDVLKSSFIKRILLNNHISKIDHDSSPERELLARDEKEQLAQFVLKLPLKYREVIILCYYEELSVTEIAALLDLNQNTVKTRLKRGRELLKKSWEGSE
ncbi:sigma-70 family RNA polymerase sigma factor [Neobacillus mesonae]|uniref:sigma-70 family RNA polymerase sigma factor n=1 Tax=Neobacillus mesonae TaxID=1193713 RepID=UPI00257440A8|nr:sigma-70 family RNA polymerase sigma factor [Neobacillus mesonae]MED4206491.1 sigma-70 family RNA polymerase sigma factor [Neobacillus mesonae]